MEGRKEGGGREGGIKGRRGEEGREGTKLKVHASVVRVYSLTAFLFLWMSISDSERYFFCRGK